MVNFSWLEEYKNGPLLDDLEHLYRNAWRRVVENLGCYDETYELNRLIWGRGTAEAAITAGGKILLAHVEGQLAGSVIATPDTHRGEPALRINRLVVLPEQRGSNIGQSMLEYCEALYREQGAGWSVLFTAAPLSTLVAYYQRQGYSEWKREPVSAYGRTYDRVFLEKKLRAG